MSRISDLCKSKGRTPSAPLKSLLALESEASALLDWSTNLDFDAYAEGWLDLATIGRGRTQEAEDDDNQNSII